MENEEIKKDDTTELKEITKSDEISQQKEDVPPTSDAPASIADTIADGMPKVNEHAINHKIEADKKEVDKWSHLKDNKGVSFDPKIHRTKANGDPSLSSKGNLLRRSDSEIAKLNAKKSESGSSFIGEQKPEVKAIKPEIVQAEALGVVSANMLFTFGVAFFGQEWAPIKDEATGIDESSYLSQAFADYYKVTGRKDLPPSFVLVSAIGAYTLPRFTKPQTQDKMGKVKMFFVKWWANRKAKKFGLKVEETDKKSA